MMRAKVAAILTIAAFAATLVAVHPAGSSVPVRYLDPIFHDVAVTRDITYGQARDSKGAMEQLKLDLYTPVGDTATDRGLIIWAHGSGFRYGDKGDTGPLEDYVRMGWVGISLEYRMRPELPANAFVGIVADPASVPAAAEAARDAQHDMQAVVRWARAHAALLGISPDRIAADGMSAGAIMALMVAFNPNDPGDSGTPGVSSAVAAAVSHAGAYVPVLQGSFPAPGAPPIAIFHGTHDEQVPYPTSPPACVLTIAMGNTCEYVTYVAREHATLGADLARDFLYRHVILAHPGTMGTTQAGVDDTITALVGAENVIRGVGATTGVVIPTDPMVISDHTIGLLEYVFGALGFESRLPGWG